MAASLSKTKNVDRLTSESSSSPSVTTDGRALCCDEVSAVGATPADAPPAIAKDMPAAPHAGKVIFRPFRFDACFARAIVDTPDTCEQMPGARQGMIALFCPPRLGADDHP
jgi:hypothetical protein